jgi:pyruvate/2-oxoglutarate dehydrogenase complex dihydrolipoamide acyltransferase (E2) component
MVDITEPTRLTIRATPVAQKIAHEQQVDLATVAERKPGTKVTRADVEAHLAETAQRSEQRPAISAQDTVESDLIPLTPVRRLIGQRMVQSITTAPHIYLDTEIDMTEAERCRERIGRSLKNKGEPSPSITALLIRATAAALMLHPEVNATLEPAALQGKDAIRRWRAVHIGIAVDTEQALLTPVLRNAHQQSLLELAQELKRLTLAARQGKLKPDELAGATFTISNLGMYGIDTFHAIIAPGQSAILAVGKVTKRAVIIEDGDTERIEVRPIMKVSLSADHRTLDGASGSRFLHQLKTFLEDPYLLL